MPELLRLRHHLNENSKGGSLAGGHAAALAVLTIIDNLALQMEDYDGYIKDGNFFYVEEEDMVKLAHASVSEILMQLIKDENFGLDYILKILFENHDYKVLQDRLASFKTEYDARWARSLEINALGDLDDHPF